MEIFIASLAFIVSNLAWFISFRSRKTQRKVTEYKSERRLLREYDILLNQTLQLRVLLNKVLITIKDPHVKQQIFLELERLIDQYNEEALDCDSSPQAIEFREFAAALRNRFAKPDSQDGPYESIH